MNVGQPFNPFGIFIGSFIPNCIMRLPDEIMTSTEKLLWARLAQYAGKDGTCYPKQEKLAEEIGREVLTIKRMLKRLEKNGFIKIIHPKGEDRLLHKNNHYVFLWHEIFEPPKISPEKLPGVSPEKRPEVSPMIPLIYTEENHIKDIKTSMSKEEKTKISDVTPNDIFKLWNHSVKNTPISKILKLTSIRERHLNARIKEITKHSEWRSIIKKITSSNFLTGNNNRNWVVNFDWFICNDHNFTKVIEGKFDNKSEPKPKKRCLDPWEYERKINEVDTYAEDDESF